MNHSFFFYFTKNIDILHFLTKTWWFIVVHYFHPESLLGSFLVNPKGWLLGQNIFGILPKLSSRGQPFR